MNISPIEIQMYADVARLRADMEQSRKVVGDAMGGIQKAVDLARVAFVALAGAASVNALRGMVGSAIEGAAALKDLQQQTGASVAALSTMSAVGKLSDTSLQTIGGAMNKLSKAMAGSTEDSRGAASAIKALGLDYDAFAKLNPEDQMQAVAKAMAEFGDEGASGASKAAIAMALWGKEGAKLLPFMADLADGAELVSKVSAEQAEMADRYGDNLTRLRVSGGEWAKELGLGLLPVLDETTQALLGVVNESGGLREQIAKLSADGTLARWGRDAVTAFSYVVDGIQYTIRFLSVLGEYIGATVADAVQMFGGVGDAIKRVLAGDFAGAVAEMQAIGTRTAAINADLAASVNAQWDAKTMGQNLRERIAQIQTVGTTAEAARKKLAFKDTTGAGPAAAGANPNAAEQDAAKAWAKAYEDFIKIAAEAQAKTADLTKAQARLVEYLGSTAYTNASDGMRQMALSAAYAAVATEQLAAAEAAQLKWLEESGSANAAALEALDKTVVGLQAQLVAQLEANAQAGLSEVALAGLAAARLEDAAATAEQRAQWAEASMLGDDLVRKYRDQAAALRGLAEAKRAGAFAADQQQTNAAGQRAIDDYLKSGSTTDLAAGFDAASQSLGTFVQLFGQLVDAQEKYNAARTAAAGNAAELAEIEAHHQRAQINSYGSLAGAAKGFFKEHTAGYKVMETAEKAFRALELGLAIKNAMEKVGLIGISTAAVAAGQVTETAAVTAGETARNTAKVPGVFMAFMSALGPWGMAAAAAAIAAVGISAAGRGGGGGSFAPTNEGTGTVFGDPSAKSESIAKSLDLLAEVDTATMVYSGQMLRALQSIDAKIGGVTNVVLRAGGITTGGDLGVAEFARKANGDPLLKMGGIDSTKGLGEGLINAVGLGGVLDTVQGWWGGISQDISKAGVDIRGSLAQVIAGGGMNRFADVTTTEKSFFGLSKDITQSTVTSALDPAIAKQFGLILAGFADFTRAAAGPLGVALGEVQGKLASFVVDIGRIDFKGLTGEQVQERLAAVFGSAGDKIAQAALPGLEQFAQVGEGYLETVTRVAMSTDLVRTTLDALGQSTAAVSGLMVDRATAALGLIEAFGGADKFTSLTSSYLEAYYSEAERAAITTRQLTTAMASMGMSLPKSRDEFRKLVDAQDLSTEAGRSQYAALLALSSAFADITDAASSAADAIASASASVQDEIKRLRGLTNTPAGSAAALQAQFAAATAQARSGSLAALESLPEISKAVDAATAAAARTGAELATMRAWLAGSLAETLRITGGGVALMAAGDAAALGGTVTPDVSIGQPAQPQAQAVWAPDLAARLDTIAQRMDALVQAQQAHGAVVAAAVTDTARILRNVTPDGDAIATRAAT